MACGDFFNLPMLENRAQKLLYEALNPINETLPIPIPIERIAEQFLDLRLLWEPIPEPRGKTILAKLTPSERRITFNENRTEFFDNTPFLYNTVLAHEIGHWELHAERGTFAQQPFLITFEKQKNLVVGDNYWDEKNADRFMSCILMPKQMLTAAVAVKPPRNFRDLYQLRKRFAVTITALKIRLEDLNLLYIDCNGRFYRNKEEATGQLSLPFG